MRADMLLVALLVGAAVPEPVPSAQAVLDAVGEDGCPKVFAMLSPAFQAKVPAARWPPFCKSVGKAKDIARIDDVDGLATYRFTSPTGAWQLKLATSDGRITGLMIAPFAEPQHAKDLADELAQVSKRAQIPGLAALALKGGKPVASAVFGVRKLGDATPAGSDDKWHLGSDTKAMTATLAAIFVDEKKLAWSTTVGDVLPEWSDIDPAYKTATVETLLEHRAGLPSDIPQPIWGEMWNPKDPDHERALAMHALLKLKPDGVGAFRYANAGYIVVGVMLEKIAGDSWEHLLAKRVFAPLAMASCGFGPPATPGHVDAPWAHRVKDGALVALEPGPESDNPPSLGPAGTVHCSLADWGRFVVEHVRGERGDKTVLPLATTTWKKLHTAPAGGDYALGWAVQNAPWSTSPVMAHDGSNGLYYVSVIASSARDLVFLVAANRGDPPAQTGVHDVMRYLVDTFTK